MISNYINEIIHLKLIVIIYMSKVSPLNERLREVPNVKLLIDVVQVNGGLAAPQLRKVLLFVCGNTLVCDTIRDAQSVAFDRSERHKVTWLHPPSLASSQLLMLTKCFTTFVVTLYYMLLMFILFPTDCVSRWNIVFEVWCDLWRLQ